MPVNIKKQKSGCYKVTTPHGTKSKCTSKKNAKAQERIINAATHGKDVHSNMRKRVMGE